MHDLGRILIILGLPLVVAGAIILTFNRLSLPLGRLPGDFTWRGKGWSVSFPLATSIVVSIFLTLLFWIIGRLRR
jgi:hypothetical protein